jgi:hypothetical protein
MNSSHNNNINISRIEIQDVTIDDLSLYFLMFGKDNKENMTELELDMDINNCKRILNSQLECSQSNNCILKKIITTSDITNITISVGTICVWKSNHQDEVISEIGWSIVSRNRNKGYAQKGIRLMLELLALNSSTYGRLIHAFININNHISNHIAKKLLFYLIDNNNDNNNTTDNNNTDNTDNDNFNNCKDNHWIYMIN